MYQGRQQTLWDRFWKDRYGHYVIWQTPNAFLIGWVLLTIFSLLVSGKLADIFAVLGSVALITWSLLEVFRGDSYFRQLLGAARGGTDLCHSFAP
jgi:hypothetical protein